MTLTEAWFSRTKYDITLYYYYKTEGKLYKLKPDKYMHLWSKKPWIFVKKEDDPRKMTYHYFTVMQQQGSVYKAGNTFWLPMENDDLANYILENTILKGEKEDEHNNNG